MFPGGGAIRFMVVVRRDQKLAPYLEDIDFSHNSIDRIDDLAFLTQLAKLNLNYNRIWSVENIVSAVGNVRELSLRGNNLETFQGASQRPPRHRRSPACTSLTGRARSRGSPGHVRRRAGLEQLKSLVVLDLGENRVSEVNEVNRLGGLPLLERINLRGNPMATAGRTYRVHVLAQFRNRAAEVRFLRPPSPCMRPLTWVPAGAGRGTHQISDHAGWRQPQRTRLGWSIAGPRLASRGHS